MKHRKNYDILEEIRKFKKMETSENFLKNLHVKLDEIISEEKHTGSVKEKKSIRRKKNIREYVSELFSKRYLIPAFGLSVVLVIFLYFFFSNNNLQITKENNNNNQPQKTLIIIPPLTGADNTNDTLRIVNPEEELNKLIIKGKEVTKEGREIFVSVLKENEKELRLFNPEDIVKNFGKFDITQSLNELKSVDLRSQSFNKEDLEVLKGKIDSIINR